jgi:hypothetical protein
MPARSGRVSPEFNKIAGANNDFCHACEAGTSVCDDRAGRLPVHPAIAMPLDLAGGCLSELDRAGLGLPVAAHAWLVMNCPASSYTI